MDYVIRQIEYYAQSYQSKAKFASNTWVEIPMDQWQQQKKQTENQLWQRLLKLFKDIKTIDQESKIIAKYTCMVQNIINDHNKGGFFNQGKTMKLNRRRMYEGTQQLIRNIVKTCRNALDTHRKRVKDNEARQQKKIKEEENARREKEKKQEKDRERKERKRREQEEEYEEKMRLQARRQEQQLRRRRQQQDRERQLQRQRQQRARQLQMQSKPLSLSQQQQVMNILRNLGLNRGNQYQQQQQHNFQQSLQKQYEEEKRIKAQQKRERRKQTGKWAEYQQMKEEGMSNKELKKWRKEQAIKKQQLQHKLYDQGYQQQQQASLQQLNLQHKWEPKNQSYHPNPQLNSPNTHYRFSPLNKHPDIALSGDRTTAINTAQKGYKLVLVDSFLNQKNCSIRFSIQSVGAFVAVGIAIKSVVAANGYNIKKCTLFHFQFLENLIRNGCFLLSNIGGTVQHSDNELKSFQTDFTFNDGDVIEVIRNGSDLLFWNETQMNEYKMKVKLSAYQWSQTSFCVCLIGNNNVAAVGICEEESDDNEGKREFGDQVDNEDEGSFDDERQGEEDENENNGEGSFEDDEAEGSLDDEQGEGSDEDEGERSDDEERSYNGSKGEGSDDKNEGSFDEENDEQSNDEDDNNRSQDQNEQVQQNDHKKKPEPNSSEKYEQLLSKIQNSDSLSSHHKAQFENIMNLLRGGPK